MMQAYAASPMAETCVPQEEQSRTSDLTLPQSGIVTSILTLLFISLIACFAIRDQLPPAAADASAPLAEFSAGRAFKYVEQISQRPHPVGSEEHKRVREYIVNELTALGVTPEVQEVNVMSPFPSSVTQIASVRNIVAKLAGSGGGGKTLMLVGHYDSTATSLGASDDGSAVATLLETLRALKSGAPLKNDTIFLFTDAEEIGMLGAKGFADHHSWAKDVGLILNFEARGTNGPSLLFETSDDNGWLAAEFGKAAYQPVGSSLFHEIYRFLPNMTDLTVFRIKGFSGLNFAYVGGLAHYHTRSDSLANIDLRSLQHQGSYALSLSRHFGNLALDNRKARNHVFFNSIGSAYVNYSDVWVMPLVYLTALLLVVVVVVGFRKKLLTLKGLIVSFFAHLGTMLCALIIVTLVSMVVRAVHSGYRLIPQGVSYNNGFYVISSLALTIAVSAALYYWLSKKLRFANLVVGALLWWMLLTAVTGWYLPGASYIFTWPLLFVLVAQIVTFATQADGTLSRWQLVPIYICGIPAVVLSASLVYLLALGLPLSMFRIALAFVVLLLALLLPLVRLMFRPRSWLLPGLFALVSVGFLIAGSLTAGFNKNDPKPVNLFYVLNADNGKAIWASSDRNLDEWAAQFVSAGASRSAISEFMPTSSSMMFMPGGGQGFWNSQTTAAPLDAPRAEILIDQTENGTRTLRLRVTSARRAPVLSVFVESDAQILQVEVNGLVRRLMMDAPSPTNQSAQPGLLPRREFRVGPSRWAMSYNSPPPEGFEVSFEIKSPPPIRIRVVDQSFELPVMLMQSYKPEPQAVMPPPYPWDLYGGSTFVSKSFNF